MSIFFVNSLRRREDRRISLVTIARRMATSDIRLVSVRLLFIEFIDTEP